MARFPFPYYLKDSVCGNPAYHLTRKLVEGNVLVEDALVHLDGSKTVAGETLKCGSCGRGFSGGLITDIAVIQNIHNGR